MKILQVWLFPALLLCLVHAQDDFDFPSNEHFPKWAPFGDLLRTSKQPNFQKTIPKDDYRTSDKVQSVSGSAKNDDYPHPGISRSRSVSSSSSASIHDEMFPISGFFQKMFGPNTLLVPPLGATEQPFASEFSNGLNPMEFGNAIPHRPSAMIYEGSPILTNTINYNKPINITKERMGGFGGLGDTRGYGAYEAPKDKGINGNLPEKAYLPEKSIFEEFPELLDMARREIGKNTVTRFPSIVSGMPLYSMLPLK